VQALQLLNAGKKERLRERNTQAALTLLAEEELLNAREKNTLRTAYAFFRTVEHRLQLLFGKQTHSLPESAAEMEFLAKRLGFRAATAFKRRVEAHRWAVRMIFSSVFALKQQRAVSGGAQGSTIVFKKNGFIDPRNAAEQFSKLKNLLPEVAESGLQSKLLTTLKKYKAPDWGLQHVLFLADNPHLRRSLLQALSNDGVLDLLGLVCSRSVNLAQLLAREPLLFETLLSNPGEVLGERFGWELLKSDLRHYQSFNEFKLGLRWLTGGTNIAQAVGEYSRLADEIVVQRVHELAHDLPIAVYALGKYGGREITARSDLDVLFVYRKTDESSPRKAEELARRFSASFIENGILVYDVDMRLRPEGKSAPLAVEISYYRDYLQRRASLWERQSLVKFRAIAGDEKLVQEVESVIHNATYAAPLPRGWVDEVAKMRSTMEQQRSKGTRVTDDLKVGRGGLVDIEFLLQMLQLKFGANRKELQTNNSFELLNVLGSAKLLQKRDVTQLLGNLTYLRSLETLVRFNTDQSGFVLPKDAAHLAALAAGMGEKSARAFLQHIKNIQKVNRTLLNHVYTLCKR